jgi:hypothetical protein
MERVDHSGDLQGTDTRSIMGVFAMVNGNGKKPAIVRGAIIFGAVVSVISSWLFFDSRYAHSDQVKRDIGRVYVETQQSFVDMQIRQNEQTLADIAAREAAGLPLVTDPLRKTRLLKEIDRLMSRQDQLRDQRGALR